MISFKRWLLIIIWCHNTAIAQTKLNLLIGETKTITILEGADIKLSKRGLIDLQPIGTNRWQMTALKKGILIVSWTDEDGKELGRYLIHIRTKISDDPIDIFIPKYCRDGIECDPHRGLMSGEASQPLSWLLARRICLASDKCLFMTKLSATGKTQLEKLLHQTYGENIRMKIAPGGVPYLLTDCSSSKSASTKSILDHQLSGAITEGLLEVRCIQTDTASERYLLHARAVLLDESASRELGLETNGIQDPRDVRSFWDVFHSLSNDHRGHIVGEPTIQLIPGQEVEVKSGGEFPVHSTSQGEQQVEWKPVGLQLKASILPIAENMARISFAFDLSNRLSTSSQLQVSRMESVVHIRSDTPEMVGSTRFQRSRSGSRSNFSFGSIPIIGPLFRIYEDSHVQTKLYLWFYLTRNMEYKSFDQWPEVNKPRDE